MTTSEIITKVIDDAIKQVTDDYVITCDVYSVIKDTIGNKLGTEKFKVFIYIDSLGSHSLNGAGAVVNNIRVPISIVMLDNETGSSHSKGVINEVEELFKSMLLPLNNSSGSDYSIEIKSTEMYSLQKITEKNLTGLDLIINMVIIENRPC